ncbi:uncharacterized protein LOC100569622 [Acyrthosiphon pisum]|uniref:Uncharacterized protein n=1 Tax=Acyrthosiphon pisum TaxID=7029 RepID=A0A8R2A9H2_ACYPI|nr:uncharacterized protein LOC100569622 [Acyrthosiphon pisum]|eukprot:XP_003241799.1 PREDICTED: uncharacterized protein LOC100569622 [Acyrthosiphon pisum]
MEQNTEPSMSTLWSRCRIVGFINVIYFGFLLILLLLIMAFSIITVLLVKSSESEAAKDKTQMPDLMKNHFVLLMIILCSLCIIMLIFFIVFIRVNYGITSETPHDNGVITGRWLIYHKVLFCIHIIPTIISIAGGLGILITDVIILIIMAIEIYVVNAYHTKVTQTGGII